jgi:hypothetical protein
MKEGTVPVYPYSRCAYSDDDELPVQEVSQFEGAKAVRVNPSRASSFLTIFYENRSIRLYKDSEELLNKNRRFTRFHRISQALLKGENF